MTLVSSVLTGHYERVSHKTRLLLVACGVGLAGALLVVLGLTSGETVGALLVVLGAIVVALAAGVAIATDRWLRPSTRLSEGLRPAVQPGWRGRVMSLEMSDGSRITCVVVRPGGYIVPRRTDPPFDTREVVAVVPATEADFDAERERQQSAR